MNFVKYRYGGLIWRIALSEKTRCLIIPITNDGELLSTSIVGPNDYVVIDDDLNIYGMDSDSAEKIMAKGVLL